MSDKQTPAWMREANEQMRREVMGEPLPASSRSGEAGRGEPACRACDPSYRCGSLGICYHELERRSASARAGNVMTHEEAMARIPAPAPASPSEGETCPDCGVTPAPGTIHACQYRGSLAVPAPPSPESAPIPSEECGAPWLLGRCTEKRPCPRHPAPSLEGEAPGDILGDDAPPDEGEARTVNRSGEAGRGEPEEALPNDFATFTKIEGDLKVGEIITYGTHAGPAPASPAAGGEATLEDFAADLARTSSIVLRADDAEMAAADSPAAGGGLIDALGPMVAPDAAHKQAMHRLLEESSSPAAGGEAMCRECERPMRRMKANDGSEYLMCSYCGDYGYASSPAPEAVDRGEEGSLDELVRLAIAFGELREKVERYRAKPGDKYFTALALRNLHKGLVERAKAAAAARLTEQQEVIHEKDDGAVALASQLVGARKRITELEGENARLTSAPAPASPAAGGEATLEDFAADLARTSSIVLRADDAEMAAADSPAAGGGLIDALGPMVAPDAVHGEAMRRLLDEHSEPIPEAGRGEPEDVRAEIARAQKELERAYTGQVWHPSAVAYALELADRAITPPPAPSLPEGDDGELAARLTRVADEIRHFGAPMLDEALESDIRAAAARLTELEGAEKQADEWCDQAMRQHDLVQSYRRQLSESQSHAARAGEALEKACEIIERADARLLATDGPCGGLPPDMTLAEWRELYVTLDSARRPS